jgi:hypothetical protein
MLPPSSFENGKIVFCAPLASFPKIAGGFGICIEVPYQQLEKNSFYVLNGPVKSVFYMKLNFWNLLT